MRIILFNKSFFLDNTSSGLFSTIIDLVPNSINLDHGIGVQAVTAVLVENCGLKLPYLSVNIQRIFRWCWLERSYAVEFIKFKSLNL